MFTQQLFAAVELENTLGQEDLEIHLLEDGEHTVPSAKAVF